MAKKQKVDPDAIWKFDGTAYTAGGIGQMNDLHLLGLHNKLANALGHEERTSLPSRKLLEGRVVGMLIQWTAAPAKAPKGEPAKKAAKSGVVSDSGKNEMETDMNPKAKKNAKTANKAAASTDRRKGEVSKERKARTTFAGHKFTAKSKDNPCREGTGRHGVMGIIIKNPGISYEDFVKKGGDSFNLRFCIDKGYVAMK